MATVTSTASRMKTLLLPAMFTTLAQAWKAEPADAEEIKELWQAALEGAIQEWLVSVDPSVVGIVSEALEIDPTKPAIRSSLATHVLEHQDNKRTELKVDGYRIVMWHHQAN